MEASDPKLSRLQQLLNGELSGDQWCADESIGTELSQQWRLLRDVAAFEVEGREQYARNLQDLARSEDRIRMDHAGRYPIELLQNAQDACADAGIKGAAWFHVTPTSLLVANQGVPFTPDRIRSLTRLGDTTKKPGNPRRRTIGYKGIGFTSVFELSRKPQVISQGVAFEFDRELASLEVARILRVPKTQAPGRYFPFPVDADAWAEDAEVVDRLLEEGAVTVVRLPFSDGGDPEEISSDVTGLLTPSTLLLMPALNELHFGDAASWIRRRGRKVVGGQLHHIRSRAGETRAWLVTEDTVPLTGDEAQALEDEAWSEVRTLNVLAAIPWANGGPDAGMEDPPALHAYFPTDDKLGRAILAHGDFFLHSSRKRIQDSGPGGVVSNAVMQGIVSLVRELAVRMSHDRPDQMAAFLKCLAPKGSPDGYGQTLARVLDDAVGEAPILPTIKGERTSPKRARLFGVDAAPAPLRDLGAMLPDIPSLADPGCELAAQDWLQKLGAEPITPLMLQKHLRAENAPSYDRAVLAVKVWHEGSRSWIHPGTLNSIRVLQDSNGAWRCAKDLAKPGANVPTLPPGLEKTTYLPPSDAEAAGFVQESMQIREMTLEYALDVVLGAIRWRGYGTDDEERQAAHDFALRVYRANPDVLESHEDRGRLPVPVRSWRRGPHSGWRKAEDVYFSRDWTGNNDLEHLYRRFKEREFLGVEPPKTKKGERELRDFYASLGVSDTPRVTVFSGDLWAAPDDWQALPEVQEAKKCPDVHPRKARKFSCYVMDRLQEVLDGITGPEALALARILGRRRHPYSGQAEVWCTHSSHRKQRRRKAIGVQRWLLEERSWIPVIRDPLGREFVRPGEAWVHVNGRALQACLPRTTLPDRLAERLEIPSATNPPPEAIARALITLRDAFPQLAEAGEDVPAGCQALVTKFERSLRRLRGTTYDGPRPPLVALRSTVPIWADAPAVQDISFPYVIPIAVLPEGSWEEIARRFALPAVSSLITTAAEVDQAAPADLHDIPKPRMVQLAALLTTKGADLRIAAARLAQLEVQVCSSIRVVYEGAGETAIEARTIHLEPEDGDAATLYVVDPLPSDGRPELARILAGHLECPSEAETIFGFMASGDQLLRFHNVGKAALEEAAAAMERYRAGFDAESLPTPVAPTEPRPGMEGANASDPRTGEGGPEESSDSSRASKDTSGPPRRQVRFVDPPSPPPEESRLPEIGSVTFTVDTTSNVVSPAGEGPSGARGGTGISGGPTISRKARRDVELFGIELAKQFALDHYGCSHVRDVQEQNKGWDLEFVKSEDLWWPVEVKSFSASAESFALTRNELDAATSRTDYRILLITGIGQGNGEVLELKGGPGTLEKADLNPLSWSVSAWQGQVGSKFRWKGS